MKDLQGCSAFCYASKRRYNMKDLSFVKNKFFNNFNELLQHIKNQNCHLLSYVDLGGKIKATLRYRGGK